jgi:hypothetical protein
MKVITIIIEDESVPTSPLIEWVDAYNLPISVLTDCDTPNES